MEGRKPTASSSSYSFTNELFGSKDSSSSSSSSSSRIFGSIFSSPPKVLGRESLRSESMEKKHEPWNNKPGVPGDASKSSATESEGTPNKDFSSLYQEQRVQPCHLSSSIYYGGQDIYSQPQNSQGPGINSVLKKDGEDDSGSASRGNWWQGSLYY